MRYGYIQISRELAMRENGILPKAFSKIQFTPIHIDNVAYFNVLKYYGHSPKFRELTLGEAAPEYSLEITHSDIHVIIDVGVKERK